MCPGLETFGSPHPASCWQEGRDEEVFVASGSFFGGGAGAEALPAALGSAGGSWVGGSWATGFGICTVSSGLGY